MAKIRPSMRAKRGTTKKVPARVIVHRTAERGNAAFEACIRIGGKALRGGHASECAYGRNPRHAVANALRSVAGDLKKRKGAFRGTR